MADEWFYFSDDDQRGPVSSKELRELATTGRLQSVDLVWKEGVADWVPASKVVGLFPKSADRPQDAHEHKSLAIQAASISGMANRASSASRLFLDRIKCVMSHCNLQRFAETAKPRLDLSGVRATGTKLRQFVTPARVAIAAVLLVACLIFSVAAKWKSTNGHGGHFAEVSTVFSTVGSTPSDLPHDVTGPDFSTVDYSIPAPASPYDFSTLDYSKGPEGQRLEQQIGYINSGTGKSQNTRPTQPGWWHRVVATGFKSKAGEFVLHGMVRKYGNQQRALLPTEAIPKDVKEREPESPISLIRLDYAEKLLEQEFYNGQQHGKSQGWFPTQDIGYMAATALDSDPKHLARTQFVAGGIEHQGSYVNGKRHGLLTIYEEFIVDPRHSKRKATFKASEIHYFDGVEHGPHIAWAPDGTKAWEGGWKNGKMHGHWSSSSPPYGLLSIWTRT